MHFMLKCLDFLLLVITWLQCPIKAVNVAYGNTVSNRWAFPVLETKFSGNVQLFKNFSIGKTMLRILLKFVQLTLNE